MAAPRVLFRSPAVDRRQQKSKIGEMAGGTAAVFCCCPCTVLNLLMLAVYKVPVGVWRKLKRRRLAKKKKTLLLLNQEDAPARKSDVTERNINDELSGDGNCEDDDGVVTLEKEMWDRFYNTGFWRSPSQKDT